MSGETYVVEYRLAGLTFRITVDVPAGMNDHAIEEAARLADRMIGHAADIARESITVVRGNTQVIDDGAPS